MTRPDSTLSFLYLLLERIASALTRTAVMVVLATSAGPVILRAQSLAIFGLTATFIAVHLGTDAYLGGQYLRKAPTDSIIRIRTAATWLAIAAISGLSIAGIVPLNTVEAAFIAGVLIGVGCNFRQVRAAVTGCREAIIRDRLSPEIVGSIIRVAWCIITLQHSEFARFAIIAFFASEFLTGLSNALQWILDRSSLRAFSRPNRRRVTVLNKEILGVALLSVFYIGLLYLFQRADFLILGASKDAFGPEERRLILYQQVMDASGLLVLALTATLSRLGFARIHSYVSSLLPSTRSQFLAAAATLAALPTAAAGLHYFSHLSGLPISFLTVMIVGTCGFALYSTLHVQHAFGLQRHAIALILLVLCMRLVSLHFLYPVAGPELHLTAVAIASLVLVAYFVRTSRAKNYGLDRTH